MLDPPVGDVAVELDGDLDPLDIRVIEARARGATLMERMRALFASTGLKSLTMPNASISIGRRRK